LVVESTAAPKEQGQTKTKWLPCYIKFYIF